MMRLIAFALLLLLSTTAAWAQIDTDRPNQSVSPVAVPKGALQLEAGLQRTQNITTQLSVPNALIRVGLLKGLEIRVTQESLIQKFDEELTLRGFSDLRAGFKYHFTAGSEGPLDLGIVGEGFFPTGSRFFTQDEYGFFGAGLATYQFDPKNSVTVNVGYNYRSDNNRSVTSTLSYSHQFSGGFSGFTELYGSDWFSGGGFYDLDFGILYSPWENVQFDLAYGTEPEIGTNFLTVGASFLVE